MWNPLSSTTDRGPTHQQNTGRVRFGLSMGVIAIVWCIILPWTARRPAMDEHLQWLDDRGIDPSAMYYTELKMMEPILHRLERQRQVGAHLPVSSSAAHDTTVPPLASEN
jgi:hypothetical protein